MGITPNGLAPANGAKRYSYDTAGQLVTAEHHDGSAYQVVSEMAYDGLRQRWQVIAWSGGISTTTTYAVDPAQGGVVLAATASSQTTVYVHGLAGPLAELTASWGYFLPDGLGSVRQLVDSSGGVTLAKSYEPYGEQLSSSGTGATSHGFTGEWSTSYQELTLVYLRTRWYRPASGTFQTRDFWPGDYSRPQSFNGWAYVEGDPINYTDPSGRIRCDLLPPADRPAECQGGPTGNALTYDYKLDPVLAPYAKPGRYVVPFRPQIVPVVYSSTGFWIDDRGQRQSLIDAVATWQAVDDTYLLAAAIMAEQGQLLLTPLGKLDGLGIGWVAVNRTANGVTLRQVLLRCTAFALAGTPKYHPATGQFLGCAPGNSAAAARLSSSFGGVQAMKTAYILAHGIRRGILRDPTAGRLFFGANSGRARFGYEYGCDEKDATGNCIPGKPYLTIEEIKASLGIGC